MNKIYLEPIFDSRKSFYKKAWEVVSFFKTELYSYGTLVAYIDTWNEKAVVIDTHSATTLRHIKEFLKQNGYKAETKAQIEEDYMS